MGAGLVARLMSVHLLRREHIRIWSLVTPCVRMPFGCPFPVPVCPSPVVVALSRVLLREAVKRRRTL
jgi:hypothetical protein